MKIDAAESSAVIYFMLTHAFHWPKQRRKERASERKSQDELPMQVSIRVILGGPWRRGREK
jgi:hypothetical protein